MDLIKLLPVNQQKLFSYSDIFLKILKLDKIKKMPNKILLSGPKGIGKSTFAYHLINYIFSKNEDFEYDLQNLEINNSNRSFKLLLNNSHPNFHLIDILSEKNVIEISQIRQMINYANKSAFNNKERIILIDNAEFLNLNSVNALLKIIEEPNENVIFILIFDNNKYLLDTLTSRCIKFNLSLTFKESIEITNKIINKNIYDLIDSELINYYDTPGNLIDLLKFSILSNMNLSKIKLYNFLNYLIDEKHYKKDNFIKKNIYKYIEFYFLSLMKIDKSRKEINYYYNDFIHKIYNMKRFNLDEESIFIQLKNKVLNG